MTSSFKEFIASIVILSDNLYDRDDLASLGKTLAQADKMPVKIVPSLVHQSDKEDCHAEAGS